jgi:hypothetical protein
MGSKKCQQNLYDGCGWACGLVACSQGWEAASGGLNPRTALASERLRQGGVFLKKLIRWVPWTGPIWELQLQKNSSRALAPSRSTMELGCHKFVWESSSFDMDSNIILKNIQRSKWKKFIFLLPPSAIHASHQAVRNGWRAWEGERCGCERAARAGCGGARVRHWWKVLMARGGWIAF